MVSRVMLSLMLMCVCISLIPAGLLSVPLYVTRSINPRN